MRSFIAFFATLSVAALVAAMPAGAQLGYLRFGGHISGGGAHFQRTPAHVYFSQGDNLVEKPDVAFSPGSYTIARIEFDYKGCTAVGNNVAFTIAAGQVTEIDPALSLVSCLIQVAPGSSDGGAGHVQMIEDGQVIFDCVVAPSTTGGVPAYGPFDSCNHTVGYGGTFHLRIIPHDADSAPFGPGCAPESGDPATALLCPQETADTNYTINGYQIATGFEGSASVPDPVADFSIARISTLKAGLGLVSTYRVTNHGPSAAVAQVVAGANSGGPTYLGRSVAGPCVRATCQQLIPASASLDFVVRIAPLFAHDGGGNIILPGANLGCDVIAVVPAGAQEITEPNTSNNTAPCIGTDVTVAVTPGTNAPPNATLVAGSNSVPMLQFTLDPPSPITLDDITLTATGTGNEQVDVTAVKLYVDTNGNGVVDGGESAIASGTFPSNDGTVVLDVSPDYAVSTATSFLVTYDFNTSIAPRLVASLAMFALLPFGFTGRRQRRRWAALVMVMIASIAVASCGGDSGPTGPSGGTATYKATLTGVTASGTAVTASVAGATITIAK